MTKEKSFMSRHFSGAVLAVALMAAPAMAQTDKPAPVVKTPTPVVIVADAGDIGTNRGTPRPEFKRVTTKTAAELKAEAAAKKKEAAIQAITVKRRNDRWFTNKQDTEYLTTKDGSRDVIPENLVDHRVKKETARSHGMAIIVYVNGSKSDPDVPSVTNDYKRNPKYDADDGAVFAEVTRAAQELIHAGVPVDRVILALSDDGTDKVRIIIDGLVETNLNNVAAGHGSLTVSTAREGLKQWNQYEKAMKIIAQNDVRELPERVAIAKKAPEHAPSPD